MRRVPPFSCYLLDADGTLLDFVADERAALTATLKEAGLPHDEPTLALYHRINRDLWDRLALGQITRDALFSQRFQLFSQEINQPLDSQAMNQAFLTHLSRQAHVMPHAPETLRFLRQHAQLAVLTNGVSWVQKERFRISGLLPYLDHLVISQEVGCEKPAPGIFAHALRLFRKTGPEGVLMVGDEPATDIKGARDFGITSCLMDPEGRHQAHQADYRITSLAELIFE